MSGPQTTPPIGSNRSVAWDDRIDAPKRGVVDTLRRAIQRYWAPYVFIAPFYVMFLIFGLFPPLFGFYLSFHRWDALSPPEFTGLRNYELILTDDVFWQALLNNVIIAVIATGPCLSLALVCAFLLNRSIRRLQHLYLASLFSPSVCSAAAVALIFGLLYGNEFGMINAGLRAVGLPPVDWLRDPVPMKASLAILTIWRWLGYNTVIYLAGLQAIPNEYYEAARVDGSNTWHLFRHISVPLLRPVILFTTISSTIGILQLFTEPYLLVGATGGPEHALLTMTMYLYSNGFQYFKFGYASAQAYVMFALILVGSLLNLIVIGRRRWGES